jgi:hypothetical protein
MKRFFILAIFLSAAGLLFANPPSFGDVNYDAIRSIWLPPAICAANPVRAISFPELSGERLREGSDHPRLDG